MTAKARRPRIRLRNSLIVTGFWRNFCQRLGFCGCSGVNSLNSLITQIPMGLLFVITLRLYAIRYSSLNFFACPIIPSHNKPTAMEYKTTGPIVPLRSRNISSTFKNVLPKNPDATAVNQFKEDNGRIGTGQSNCR